MVGSGTRAFVDADKATAAHEPAIRLSVALRSGPSCNGQAPALDLNARCRIALPVFGCGPPSFLLQVWPASLTLLPCRSPTAKFAAADP